jgi:hypothetical protein
MRIVMTLVLIVLFFLYVGAVILRPQHFLSMKSKEKQLVILFFVLLAVLSYPVLSVLQTDAYLVNIPLKLILVFGFWFLAIMISALIINRK